MISFENGKYMIVFSISIWDLINWQKCWCEKSETNYR